MDPAWGEPGLTAAEKVFGWCSFTVLAYEAGNPATPVNAVPPRAWARCQLRFVVGIDWENVLPALRRHLDRHGFPMVQMAKSRDEVFHATRLDPDHPWVQWAVASIARSTNKPPGGLAKSPAARFRTTSSRRSWSFRPSWCPASLPRLLAARAERAPAGGDRPRGPRDDGGAVLGFGGTRSACKALRRHAESAPAGLSFSSSTAPSSRAATQTWSSFKPAIRLKRSVSGRPGSR